MTFNTAFKNIYSDGLAEYGFKKLKGKQPWIGRMVGDEILQVISFRGAFSDMRDYKAFEVISGITTVYRKMQTLDETPANNIIWLTPIQGIYKHQNYYNVPNERSRELLKYSYKKEDEQSMLMVIEKSLQDTKEIVIPEFDKVVDIKSCVDYYQRLLNPLLRIFTKQLYERNDMSVVSNEGLLNFLVYSSEEFKEQRIFQLKRACELELERIRSGKSGCSLEQFNTSKESWEEDTNEQIDMFVGARECPGEYAQILMELENRKKRNQELFKKYGL